MKDEVYIRKLVADGEGTGEVRRFELVLASLKNMRQKGQNATEAAKCLRMVGSHLITLKNYLDRVYGIVSKEAMLRCRVLQ